jgi:hypothetical protein
MAHFAEHCPLEVAIRLLAIGEKERNRAVGSL